MMAFRAELLKALLKDAEWTVKLEKAKTMRQVQQVLTDFAKAKGYKTMRVQT